ncbi:glycine betaine ABC transporter substrate-binding protein [Devosia naphthalenivorans]|uniref:glycine betaine ABC transporter substrate-binding protein n=1 Tax=Devosia naphthalenivorans TaxID=2082392 RepID=UPI000D36B8E4|nr:glycine betaine ABC transporter substrate-binding protein [Devosia naphthalenivorans]
MTARRATALMACMLLALMTSPAQAQLTVLDQAQDAPAVAAEPAAPPPPCGNQPINIARMSWPSAELLAEIHARILRAEYGCDARVIPGDLSATGSSMGSTGQPAVAPEMWATRIAEVWNAGVEAQQVRQAAPSFADGQLEGWFIPGFVAEARPELTTAAGLAAALPAIQPQGKVQFISCPADWACSLINRNLIRAHGLEELVEIVEPANRFEMDTLIAGAVSRKEPVLFYYWRPNAILAQFDFRPLDMGAYDDEAAKCLAQLVCEAPRPSAFASEPVVVALSEWVFAEAPLIASYFQRASVPLAEMDRLLAQLNEPGATVEGVADRFVAEKRDVWGAWVGTGVP